MLSFISHSPLIRFLLQVSFSLYLQIILWRFYGNLSLCLLWYCLKAICLLFLTSESSKTVFRSIFLTFDHILFFLFLLNLNLLHAYMFDMSRQKMLSKKRMTRGTNNRKWKRVKRDGCRTCASESFHNNKNRTTRFFVRRLPGKNHSIHRQENFLLSWRFCFHLPLFLILMEETALFLLCLLAKTRNCNNNKEERQMHLCLSLR